MWCSRCNGYHDEDFDEENFMMELNSWDNDSINKLCEFIENGAEFDDIKNYLEDNACLCWKSNPLNCAVMTNRLNICKLLHYKGFVNQSPFLTSCRSNISFEIFEFLLSNNNGDVNFSDYQEMTPLMLVVVDPWQETSINDQQRKLKVILEKGADPKKRCPYGTVLHCFNGRGIEEGVVEKAIAEMLQLLVDHGADLNELDCFKGKVIVIGIGIGIPINL